MSCYAEICFLITSPVSTFRGSGPKMSARSRELEQGRTSASQSCGQTYATAEQSLRRRATPTTTKPRVERTFTPMYTKGKPVGDYQLGG